MFGASKTRSQRKSAIRFERNLGRAIEKRDDLLQKQKLSVASGGGRVAILYSTAKLFINSTEAQLKQNAIFREEAHCIAETNGKDRSLVQIAEPRSISNVLRDPEICDIILIGHGSIGNMKVTVGENYDWQDISFATKHLKAGRFVQRLCGTFRADGQSVPLGTFALSDVTNLRAPVGIPIEDVNPDESLIDQQVYGYNSDLAVQIQELNAYFAPHRPQNEIDNN